MYQLGKTGQATGGEIDRLSITSVIPASGAGLAGFAITAARNGDGLLEILVWAVNDDGKPVAVASRVDGAISEVACHAVGPLRVVVAARDATGKLRLIAYTVSANGKALTRHGTKTAGAVRGFAMTSIASDSVTVAMHLEDRRVVIGTWSLSGDHGFGSVKSVAVGSGKVKGIDVAGVLGEFCLIACTDTGTLRLRAFKSPTALGGDATGGKVRSVAITGVDSFDGYWTAAISKEPAAVRTGLGGTGRLILDTGRFELSHWEFDNGTLQSPLTRSASTTIKGMAGIAWDLHVLEAPMRVVYLLAQGADTYEKLLAKNRGKPKLRLFAFEQKSDKIERLAQGNMGGEHALVCMARIATLPPHTTKADRLLLAARDGHGKLKLIAWRATD